MTSWLCKHSWWSDVAVIDLGNGMSLNLYRDGSYTLMRMGRRLRAMYDDRRDYLRFDARNTERTDDLP